MQPALLNRILPEDLYSVIANMPHLPNEIWLEIITSCDPRDLWLSVRTSNRQLSDCVEQYVKDEVLPQITMTLHFALPSYDIRQPMRGMAIFHHTKCIQSDRHTGSQDRVSYCLSRTEPEHYLERFLDRWEGMREKADGSLGDSLLWDVQLGDRIVKIGLKEGQIVVTQDVDLTREAAQLSFEWQSTLTRFFR